jgi:hypothetical protein
MATRVAKGFMDALQEAYGEGREDWSRAYRAGRTANNQSEDAPRLTEMTGAYPTGIRIMENLNSLIPKEAASRLKIAPDTNKQLVREDLGIGLQPRGQGRRTGQMVGTLLADATQDNTRSFYWLGNAIQALGSIGQEQLLGKFAPQLYGTNPLTNAAGGQLNKKKKADREYAIKQNYLDGSGKPTKGVRFDDDGNMSKRRFEPGAKAALLIPSGLAINAGIGLMSPMGGAPGYTAVIPEEDDLKVSANPVLEVAGKYLTGRTGNLLPYDEFKEERPDVSRGEYNAYKGFKYDKDVDLNPFDDGDVTLPMGLGKFTSDGIHGPELQFFGKSLPMTTGGIPLAAALAGTTYGATRSKPIRGGLTYGLGGYAIGTAAGAITEELRRRANAASNEAMEY